MRHNVFIGRWVSDKVNQNEFPFMSPEASDPHQEFPDPPQGRRFDTSISFWLRVRLYKSSRPQAVNQKICCSFVHPARLLFNERPEKHTANLDWLRLCLESEQQKDKLSWHKGVVLPLTTDVHHISIKVHRENQFIRSEFLPWMKQSFCLYQSLEETRTFFISYPRTLLTREQKFHHFNIPFAQCLHTQHIYVNLCQEVQWNVFNQFPIIDFPNLLPHWPFKWICLFVFLILFKSLGDPVVLILWMAMRFGSVIKCNCLNHRTTMILQYLCSKDFFFSGEYSVVGRQHESVSVTTVFAELWLPNMSETYNSMSNEFAEGQTIA